MKKFVSIAAVALLCIALLGSCKAKDKCPGVGQIDQTETPVNS